MEGQLAVASETGLTAFAETGTRSRLKAMR